MCPKRRYLRVLKRALTDLLGIGITTRLFHVEAKLRERERERYVRNLTEDF